MNNLLNGVTGTSTAELLKQKAKIDSASGNGLNAFSDQLKSAMTEVNDMQKSGENAMANLATGQVKDLHQAALAIDKAEISMKLMLEIRNKALNAYKELGRTQL
jgi:flagellar hook-basal body complex protein FliE